MIVCGSFPTDNNLGRGSKQIRRRGLFRVLAPAGSYSSERSSIYIASTMFGFIYF